MRWEWGVDATELHEDAFPTLAARRERWMTEQRAIRAYIDPLTEEALNGTIRYVIPGVVRERGVWHRPIASQGFLLVPLNLALNQPEFLTGRRPSMDGGLGKARKLTFILLEQPPVCVSGGLHHLSLTAQPLPFYV